MRTNAPTRKPRIKAPPPVILTRCQIGKNILHVRTQAVKAATVDTWNIVEGKGWLKYCRHAAKCDQCGAYEAQKKLAQDQRFDKKDSSEINLKP